MDAGAVLPTTGNNSVGDDESGGAEEAVRVFVRIRPLNKREIAEKQTIGWNFNETSMLEDTLNGQRVYAYDHCFGPNGTNQETYDIVGKPVVLKAMEGYNGTVFTYGQTGSGKTWTMRGCETDPGMMILCIRDIMEWVDNHPLIHYTLRVSYLEVYNEEINDLLDPASKNLRIVSEDAAKGAVIGGLIEEVVKTPADFMAILQRGEASRSYASTNMNAESSRSHTIYRVSIEAYDKDTADDVVDENAMRSSSNSSSGPNSRTSYLNLVDLAGSERQKSTKASGTVLKEGANINKSLLALGAVISKLGEASKKVKGAKPVFIPYRDSKLTRILKQSLGGNTLTSILCAVTPAPMHREETVSTLKFGQLCKSIKNNVKSNDSVLDDKALLKQYRLTIAELRAQLDELSATPDYAKIVSSTDPASALAQALHEKSELEIKVRNLEAMLLRGNNGLKSSDLNQVSEFNIDEDKKLTEKISEQQRLITSLQRQLGEFQDLEESKTAFEEHESQTRAELDEEHEKLEKEKQSLQTERYKMLKDRSNIEEKESRVGLLITNLDERESRLRQMIGTMKEQEEQWKRSITDLQRREDLVDDWQKNHHKKEKNLQDVAAMQEKKFAELNKREAEISEHEQQFKIQQRGLQEREQKLQLGLNRVANTEQAMATLEDKLNAHEALLRKREQDADIRERELSSRRKEMESWNELLREKDRKVSVEQRTLDERDVVVRAAEEKVRAKDLELERKLSELRQRESSLAEEVETHKRSINELDEKDKEVHLSIKNANKFQEELAAKEIELKTFEKKLLKLQQRMSGIEEKEMEVNKRIDEHKKVEDEFFNVKIAQITARHGKELAQLESLVTQQLKIVADSQKEIESTRAELNQKCSQIEEYEETLKQRDELIQQLRR
eukprot:gene12022-16093_t